MYFVEARIGTVRDKGALSGPRLTRAREVFTVNASRHRRGGSEREMTRCWNGFEDDDDDDNDNDVEPKWRGDCGRVGCAGAGKKDKERGEGVILRYAT